MDMKVFTIAYMINGKKHEIEQEGFDKAQSQVALIMNAGGEILGIKEEVE